MVHSNIRGLQALLTVVLVNVMVTVVLWRQHKSRSPAGHEMPSHPKRTFKFATRGVHTLDRAAFMAQQAVMSESCHSPSTTPNDLGGLCYFADEYPGCCNSSTLGSILAGLLDLLPPRERALCPTECLRGALGSCAAICLPQSVQVCAQSWSDLQDTCSSCLPAVYFLQMKTEAGPDCLNLASIKVPTVIQLSKTGMTTSAQKSGVIDLNFDIELYTSSRLIRAAINVTTPFNSVIQYEISPQFGLSIGIITFSAHLNITVTDNGVYNVSGLVATTEGGSSFLRFPSNYTVTGTIDANSTFKTLSLCTGQSVFRPGALTTVTGNVDICNSTVISGTGSGSGKPISLRIGALTTTGNLTLERALLSTAKLSPVGSSVLNMDQNSILEVTGTGSVVKYPFKVNGGSFSVASGANVTFESPAVFATAFENNGVISTTSSLVFNDALISSQGGRFVLSPGATLNTTVPATFQRVAVVGGSWNLLGSASRVSSGSNISSEVKLFSSGATTAAFKFLALAGLPTTVYQCCGSLCGSGFTGNNGTILRMKCDGSTVSKFSGTVRLLKGASLDFDLPGVLEANWFDAESNSTVKAVGGVGTIRWIGSVDNCTSVMAKIKFVGYPSCQAYSTNLVQMVIYVTEPASPRSAGSSKALYGLIALAAIPLALIIGLLVCCFMKDPPTIDGEEIGDIKEQGADKNNDSMDGKSEKAAFFHQAVAKVQPAPSSTPKG